MQVQDDSASMLAVYLLDLRAQYELELRLLTKLQRALEEFRAPTRAEPQRHLYVQLEEQVKALRYAHRTIEEGLAETENQLRQLRPADIERRSPDHSDRRTRTHGDA
jgi:hypothetical protein